MKLLLVEDEPDLAKGIRDYLKGNDFVCEWVNTAASAINKLSDHDYDCILLDLMLPDGDGLQVLKELKRQNKRKALSSFLQKKHWKRASKVLTWEQMISL